MPIMELLSSRKRRRGSCNEILACKLDPATEVNHCIGSKTALAMLPAAFINPGDVTLMTVPGYPVAGTHTKYYGGDGPPVAAAGAERLFPGFGIGAGRGARSYQVVGAVLPK